MNSASRDDDFFGELASRSEGPGAQQATAPARLKSKIYSALIRQQQESGPLLSLTYSKAAGRGLCFFETLLQIAPMGEAAKSFNACRVCHARVLAERVEKAPIFWAHCPYVAFQKE